MIHQPLPNLISHIHHGRIQQIAMKLSRLMLYMVLTAGCRGAYVQFQDCSEAHDSSSLIPESFRASVERGRDTFDWKFDFTAGLTNRNSCEVDLSNIVPRFSIVDHGNDTPYIPGQIVNISCLTSQRIGSRSKFTIVTSFNRSTLLETYKTTFELTNSNNTTLSCVRAVLTPAVPATIRIIGLWFPIITFALACVAACWPVRRSSRPNTTKNSLVARAIDVLAYIQFIFFSGAMSLQYPGFFQPLVGLSGWSTLMLPAGVVESRSSYARQGVNDGIYEHNGTITGAPGLELLTQMTGSAVKPQSWMNTFVLSLLVFVSLYIFSFIIHRLGNTNSSPRSASANLESSFRTQYWAVVRLFLSCFMLPLSAWATYQFLDGTIFGYQNSVMAILVLSLLLAGFYWSWSQDPEMASLVIHGPNRARRKDKTDQKYCALIVFFLMLLRGCILGGLQTYNSVQVGLLLACEAMHLMSMTYWIGFSHFTSLPGILSMARIALSSINIGFLPGVTGHSGKILVAYIALCGHVIILICIFLIPTLFDLGKLAFGREPAVLSDIENDMQSTTADTLFGENNELVKSSSSQSSASNKTLLDMILSRETKIFGDKTVSRIQPEVLSLFMRKVQGEDEHTNVCEISRGLNGSSNTLVGSTQSDEEIKSAVDVSPDDALTSYLVCKGNLAIRNTPIYQDMDHPINEYFISTSHNTYLLGRQVATRSKLEGYIEALSKGCRSVEIDCWDGRNGQPVVKHGYSLTTSVSFRSVINTIKEHAFVSSDLPLWLSLEVHCCSSQRDIMAQVMIEVFGSSLITEPLQGCLDTLPSPNQLRGKILIKAKMPQDMNTKDSDEEGRDAIKLDQTHNGVDTKPERGDESTAVTNQLQRKHLQEDSLQRLAIYGAGKRLPQPDAIDSHRNFIYSMSETKLSKRISKEKPLGIIGTQHMVRVYPDPNRVDSSNFDPIKCWQHGVQMAALNYQTNDFNMRLNDAMFAGSLGYVLKAQPEPKQIRIAVDVLMVGGIHGLVVDSPVYVELELILPDMPSQRVRTTAASTHGTGAVFDQNLDISMGTKYPHLAFLHWRIKSLSNSRPISTESGIAKVSNLKKGYRMLPLGVMEEKGGFILWLIGTVTKTAVAVTTFTRDCREARSDLTSINGELSQLQLVLELLRDDTAVSDGQILPESLQEQILSIIDNCSAVVSKINLVLDNHSGKVGALKWATIGKSEVVGLRMSLEAHRGSLNLALDLVSISLSKAIKSDTAAIRTDVHDIKQDTSQIPQIMDELNRLRAIVAGGDVPAATIGQNYILQQYLDDLTSYAETVCNDVEWETDSSVHALSRSSSPSGPVIQLETSADARSQVASLPDTDTRVCDKGDKTYLQPTKIVSTLDTSKTTSQAKKKIVLVGDSACGKTALCRRFLEGTFLATEFQTVFETYAAHIDGVDLSLWDTSGMDDNDRLRPLSYPDADAVLICFSFDYPDSLENVVEKWIGEVVHFLPGVPCILVGLKKDLRYDEGNIKELKKYDQQPVTWDQGNDTAKRINAFRYVECSAKTGHGVKEVFDILVGPFFPAVKKRSNGLKSMFKRWSSR
ncbi:hypothetical protein NXS19_006063 [Fusarium pseudograminearum]|nr:hypothetical protein NXS19_006063 [Fusarium pseudograminearum]